jgi:integrase
MVMRNLTKRGKSYVVVVRDRNGKQVWHSLGPIKDWTGRKRELAAKVADVARAIREGKDRTGPETFERIMESFFKHYVGPQGLRTGKTMRACLSRHVLPKWAGRDFAEIRRGDITKLLDDIVSNAGPVMADRVLATIGKMMNWYATRHDDYSSPIVRGMRRANPKDRARSRILTDDEIRQLWNADETSLVKMLLLTGQRRDKVASMKWEDVKDGIWTIATESREKSNAGELVLPKEALAVLDELPRYASSPYVFGPRRSFSHMKKAIDAAVPVPHWVLHDLRRTARSLMSRAGVRPDIAERVLGHVQQGVEGIYDRHDYRAEKADALKRLATLLATIINPAPDNVLRLHG